MNASFLPARVVAAIGLIVAIALLNGCGRSEEAADEAAPRNPKEAGSQLQQVFATAAPNVKQNADAASAAMQAGDYEKAVVSLQVVQSAPNITMEQGLAIHHSVVTVEAQIINRMDAGDEKAKRAFQLLKQLKRN